MKKNMIFIDQLLVTGIVILNLAFSRSFSTFRAEDNPKPKAVYNNIEQDKDQILR